MVSAPYDRIYRPEEVTLPANARDTFEGKSELQQRAARGELLYPHRPKDEDALRKCIAYYYRLVSLIDGTIGPTDRSVRVCSSTCSASGAAHPSCTDRYPRASARRKFLRCL